MKKILAIILTAVLFVTVSATSVFALPSPEAEGVVAGITSVDKNGEENCIILEKIDDKVSNEVEDVIEDLKKEEKDETLKPVDHYEIIVIGKPKFEVTVTLDIVGITSTSKVIILLENEDGVDVIHPIIKDGKVTFDLPEGYDRLVIVTDGKTANKLDGEDVQSPQTSDITPFVAVLMAAAGIAVIVNTKKVKA